MSLTLVDLFCGCGGTSAGFSWQIDDQETIFEARLGLDYDPIAMKTYQHNFPKTQTLTADINRVDPRFILSLTGLRERELDCLVACPPCQSYSVNNRSRSQSDDRNILFRRVLDFLRVIHPKTVFIENVPGMRTCDDGRYHREITEQLDEMQYEVKYCVVNSVLYGVPQNRRRFIYIAYDRTLGIELSFPIPTHEDSINSPNHTLSPVVTVGEAIGDLPELKPNEKSRYYEKGSRARASEYARMFRPVRKRRLYNHAARNLNEMQLERLKCLKEGEAIAHLPDHLRPKMGFRGAYGRVWRDKPASTITTGFYGPSRGRFSHYEQNRTLTVREGARLQSFRDDFVFLGSMSQNTKLIGNAVPPLLARAFRIEIARSLS